MSFGDHTLDKIFRNLKDLDTDTVDKRTLMQRFSKMGILEDDHRIKGIK
jgi:hypothetical protein